MADDTSTDALVAGALFVGGGLAGYFGSRWLRPKEAHAAPTTTTTAAPPVAVMPTHRPTIVTSTTPITETAVATATPTPTPTPADAAPVSSPEQVDAAPVSSPEQASAPSAPPPAALPRTFDPLFEKHRESIPIEFLRALAMRESGMKPMAKGKGGAAWGLLQITEDVRADFNRANGTDYSRGRLLEPAVNVAIGCWLLRLIADAYQRRHGDLRNMRTDWTNPRFAELLVFGWNAGFSSGGGVMRVVGKLKELGARDVDIDLVHENAGHLGGGRHLRDATRVRWAKSVVALYQRERAGNRNARNASLFTNPVELWDRLCAHFIGRRPVVREAGPRGWVFPQTTRLEVEQAAMVLDLEINGREIDPDLGVVLDRWRTWKGEFRAELRKDAASGAATYPQNEMFWLELSYQLAAALAGAPRKKPSGGDPSWYEDAGGWVWDHKRWLWPVPGVAASLEVVSGGAPELADFVPGLDLAGHAAGAVADGAKDTAEALTLGLLKPLAIGVGVLGGVLVLATVLRD